MTAKNESVIIYQTWLESSALMGEKKQLKAIMQIINYGIYGTVPDNSDDPMMQMLLMNWMPLVDAQKKKRKGGAPKGNKNAVGNKGGPGRPKKTQPKTQPFNVNGNVNGNINANDNDLSLPSVDTPTSLDVVGDATSGDQEPDWMREEYHGE